MDKEKIRLIINKWLKDIPLQDDACKQTDVFYEVVGAQNVIIVSIIQLGQAWGIMIVFWNIGLLLDFSVHHTPNFGWRVKNMGHMEKVNPHEWV